MSNNTDINLVNLQIVRRWCEAQGPEWSLFKSQPLGRGATAFVYEISSPYGLRSLKLYNADFSENEGEIGVKRIDQQIALGEHDCPSLVQVFAGGTFED